MEAFTALVTQCSVSSGGFSSLLITVRKLMGRERASSAFVCDKLDASGACCVVLCYFFFFRYDSLFMIQADSRAIFF